MMSAVGKIISNITITMCNKADPYGSWEKTERRRRKRNLRNYRRRVDLQVKEAKARQGRWCSYNSYRSHMRKKYIWGVYDFLDYNEELPQYFFDSTDEVRQEDGHIYEPVNYAAIDAFWERVEAERVERVDLTSLYQRIRDYRFVEFISSERVEPQSGEEVDPKEYSRSAVNRSRNARTFSKNKTKHQAKKDWRKLEIERRALHINSKKRPPQGAINPESGFSFGMFGKTSNHVLNHVENFVALSYGLLNAENCSAMSSMLFLYIKTISSRSVSQVLWQYLRELFINDVTVKIPDDDPFDVDQTVDTLLENICYGGLPVEDVDECHVMPAGGMEVIEVLKNLGKNFRILTTHPVFAKVSYLISACVCVGLCESSAVTWSIAGIRLFNPNMYMKHINATDLVDAVLSTVTYFVEGGYEFFKTGSLGGFLFSDTRIEQLQDDYNQLKACAMHFKVGTLKSATGMDDHDYHTKITGTIAGLRKLSRLSQGVEKGVLERMITNLCEVKMEFDATRVQGGIREKPYTIALIGPTGVGKSTLTCALPPIIGMMNGFDGSPSKTATLKADDKFQSNVRGDTTVYILEDIFNVHKDFLQTSPTESLNDASNNSVKYASKAEVDEKGRVAMTPKLVIANTNLGDAGAAMGSNEPASVERRFDLRLYMTVKPKFRIDGGVSLDWRKVLAHYNGNVPVIPDVWDMEATDPVAVPNTAAGGKDVIEYRPLIKDKDGKLRVASVYEVLRFMKDHSAEHYAAQRKLVHNTNTLHTVIKLCDKCGHVDLCCMCDAGTQSGEEQDLYAHYQKLFYGVASDWRATTGILAMNVLQASMVGIGAFIMQLAPDYWLARMLRTIFYYFTRQNDTLLMDRNVYYATIYCVWMFLITNMLLFGAWYFKLWNFQFDMILLFSVFATVWSVVNLKDKRKKANEFREDAYRWIMVDRMILKNCIVEKIRQVRIDRLLAASAVLATAYTVVKHLRNTKPVLDLFPQGNLDPQNYADIQERDAEESIWKKADVTPIVFDRRLMTHTLEDACAKIARNLCFVRIKHEFGNRVCDAFFVRTNVCVMPYHMLFDNANPEGEMPKEWHMTFQRKSPDCTGAFFSAVIDRTSWRRVPDTDFIVINVNAGGDLIDMTYLLTEGPYSGLSMFLYRDGDGDLRQEPTTLTYREDARHKYCTFKGADYHLKGGTGPGLCMGVLISQDKGKRIVGFHLGGKDPTYGVCGLLTKSMFEGTLALLSDDRIIPHSSGEFSNVIYGKTMLLSTSVHKHSPVNFLEDGGNFNIYGTCIGGATITSQVVKSLLSDLVELKMQLPNTFGPPILFPKYLPFRENLLTLSRPTIGFAPRHLIQAKNDYIAPIIELIHTRDYPREMIRVLTNKEVVNGIPGVRFIDKMNMHTSAGFPLDKPKTHFLVDLPPDDVYTNPVDFTPEIWDEVERVESLLARGERAFIIYKACVKDEPTSTLKVKAPRIINSAPIAMQILTRRYFLGLCRFINCHPFLCESMVGINCMGPEWEQHRQYMTRKGKLLDRCFALDYSKFDHFTSPQVSMMVYQMYIEICEATGNFSARDIKIMQGIATEAVYPFVAYNGTLVSWNGTTPSGTSITVYQNNGSNSLYQRLGFLYLELMPRGLDFRDQSFRDSVRVGNYGDDLKGTVSEEVTGYTMKTFQEFMGKHGIKVTMPDKSADMVEFMHWDEADFLKRRDVYIPEIKMHVGALDESSIAKSLHANLRNKNLSREELAVAVVSGAVFEYWAHGRAKSDERCSQLREIVAELGLDVPALNVSYDDRVESWKERYKKEMSAPYIVQLADEDSTGDPFIYKMKDGTVSEAPPWYTQVTDLAED